MRFHKRAYFSSFQAFVKSAMTYKDEWLLVDDVPTRILTWGTWVEDLEDNQSIVLVITGNPGVVDFYGQFLEELHTKVKMPVWAVSHAGKYSNSRRSFFKL